MNLLELKVSSSKTEDTTTLYFTDASESQTTKWALEDAGYTVVASPAIKIFDSVDSALDSVYNVLGAA